ncbi:hypothetical protein MIDIC_110039 [Alphaproteobacteria bacterium]
MQLKISKKHLKRYQQRREDLVELLSNEKKRIEKKSEITYL